MAKTAAPVSGIFEKNPGSGIWYVRYRVKGKLVRKKVGTKSQASDYLKKVKYIRSTGDGVVATSAKQHTRTKEELASMGSSGVTVGELCDDYLRYIQDPHNPNRPDDQVNPPQRISAIREAFGDRPAAGVMPFEITDWLTGLKKKGGTLNRYKSTFSSLYRYAKERAKITVNPVRDVTQFKVNIGDPRYLKPGEEDRLGAVLKKWIDDCPDEHKLTKLYLRSHPHEVTLAIGTGMRKGNLYKLTWNDIDFERGIIHLPKTKTGNSHTIVMIDDVRDALRDQMKIQAEIDELQGKSDRPGRNRGIRMNSNGRVFNISENREWWGKALKEAKIKNLRWHDLRHTTGSRLAQSGKNLKVIQVALGHKSIQTSARYAHMDQSTMKKEMSVLNRKKAT